MSTARINLFFFIRKIKMLNTLSSDSSSDLEEKRVENTLFYSIWLKKSLVLSLLGLAKNSFVSAFSTIIPSSIKII